MEDILPEVRKDVSYAKMFQNMTDISLRQNSSSLPMSTRNLVSTERRRYKKELVGLKD